MRPERPGGAEQRKASQGLKSVQAGFSIGMARDLEGREAMGQSNTPKRGRRSAEGIRLVSEIAGEMVRALAGKDAHALAEHLGRSVSTVKRWRERGMPAMSDRGPRGVLLYDLAEVRNWLDENGVEWRARERDEDMEAAFEKGRAEGHKAGYEDGYKKGIEDASAGLD